MERTVNKFIVVVKQLENGKFAIRFPDFEGITALAEREEGIEMWEQGQRMQKGEIRINQVCLRRT